MGVPLGTIRIVASGHLPQGEEFAFGWWIQHSLVGGQTELDSICAAVVAAMVAKPNTFTALNPNTAAVDEMSAYYYGDTSGVATVVSHVPVTTLVGAGSAGVELPLQCAIVVSLRTALNGRRYRGRFYVPMTSQSLTNHQLPSAETTAIASAWQSVLNTLKDAVPTLEPVVVSFTGSVATPVTSLIVDSRVDIQRRRANKQTILFSQVESIT